MRLKCIKLAGFKSFVDPTTVNFPSNMAAVVGPNGCGKSNIIDAVRWVMAELGKNLRGSLRRSSHGYTTVTSDRPASNWCRKLDGTWSASTRLPESRSAAK